MDFSLKRLLEKIINWGGFIYTWEGGTNNTTDTLVPVFNGSKIQHRVLPVTYNLIPATTSKSTRNTTDVTTTDSTNGVIITTLNHTTRTGKYVVFASAVFYTSINTSNIRVNCAGTQAAYAVTNVREPIGISILGIRSTTKNATEKVDLVLTPQSGATATLPSYNTYMLYAIDIHA